MYLEPWHCDVFEFLDLKKNTGKEENRARDLFYALWIPDLFMRRVETDGDWCLMCPHECPGLFDCWGEEFDALYEKYVQCILLDAMRVLKEKVAFNFSISFVITIFYHGFCRNYFAARLDEIQQNFVELT